VIAPVGPRDLLIDAVLDLDNSSVNWRDRHIAEWTTFSTASA
jgi:hypothetical protein